MKNIVISGKEPRSSRRFSFCTPASKMALAASISAFLVSPQQTHAATYTWDVSNVTSGAQDGSGSWDTTSANWWNGAGNQAWNNNGSDGVYDTAVFGASGTAGTVALTTVTVGGITFNSGVTGNYTLSGGMITLGNAVNTFNILQSGTIASVIAGGAGNELLESGTGTLVLTGNNLYSGGTAINGGTLNVGSANALGGGTISFGGGFLQYSAANQNDYSGAIHNSSGAVAIDTNGENVTFASTIDSSNIGGIIKTGAGTLILGGANAWNTYRGATTVDGGTLFLANEGSLPNYTMLTLNGGSVVLAADTFGYLYLGGLAGNSSSTIGLNNFMTLTVGTNNADSTFAGVVSGTGTLLKTGTGTLTLTGANTFTQGTYIDGGSVRLGDGVGTNGSLTNGISLLGTNTSLIYASSSTAGNATINASGPGSYVNFNNTSTAGNSTINASGPGSFVNFNNTSTAGNSTINASGPGSYVDFNNTSTAGNATITASGSFSYVYFASASTGGTASIVLSNPTSQLSIFAPSIAIGSLAGNGWLGLDFSLTVGSNGQSTLFSGSIIEYINTTCGLTKTGAGTLVLSGSNNYSGVTAVNGGTMQFATPGALYAGGTSNWTAANITVGNGATIAFNVGGPSDFTNANVSTLLANLSGANNGLKAGSAIGFDTTNATTSGSFTIPDNIGDSTGAGGGAVGLTKLGVNTLILSGTNTYTGLTTVSAGTLQLGDGVNKNGSVAGNIVNNASLVFANPRAQTYAGIISGNGDVTVNSGGTLTLAGSNTYTGATTISGGTLKLSPAAAPLGILNSGFELPYVGVGATAYVYAPTGLGVGWMFSPSAGVCGDLGVWVTYAPQGTQVGFLQDNSTISQSITVGAATTYSLSFEAATIPFNNYSCPSDNVELEVDGQVVTSGSWAFTSFGPVFSTFTVTGIPLTAGSHTLAFVGTSPGGECDTAIDNIITTAEAGNLPVSTAVKLTGPGSTLDLSGAVQTIGSLSGVAGATVLNNGALTAGGDNTSTTFAGAISGSGSFTKAGAGTLILCGANTYLGATNVAQGALVVSGSLNGTTSVNVSPGGLLSVPQGGLINNAAGIALSGTLSGAGWVGPVTATGAVIAPGTPGSHLTISGPVSLDAKSSFCFTLGLTKTSYDSDWSGAITLATGATLILSAPGNMAANFVSGDVISLFESVSGGTPSITGMFTNLDLPPLANGLAWSTANLYDDGQLTVIAVPEPDTCAILAGGLALMTFSWRRRRGKPGNAQ